MTARLWRFPGGLELPGHKTESCKQESGTAALPDQVVLPLQQHIGAPAEAEVEPGQYVRTGERIARARDFVSAPIHASVSGTVQAVEERPIAHPSGLSAPCVVIASDGEDAWAELQPVADYTAEAASDLRNRIREAGIVGLGGAGFPSAVKLNPGGRPVETLILNGAECEPYITCDDRLMQEEPARILRGMLIMRHALQAQRCIIGVEDNKPAAIAALKAARDELAGTEPAAAAVEVITVPTRYPAGGEKQLIYTLTGKEVPSDGLPIQVGVVCHNVGTATAVERAITEGRPLVDRLVTVTGSAIAEPRVWRVRLGTPVGDLLEERVRNWGDLGEIIVGGPMMGFRLFHHEAPIAKTTNCLLVPAAEELTPAPDPMPCIRCGACQEVCPARLLPQQLYWHARDKDFDKVQDYNLFDCIECGCCAYVCPSHLPLVQYYRFAKTEIWAAEREKKKSDIARARYEFRNERLEREKAEKAARQAEKKKQVNKGDDKKKAAIEAARKRAQEKKEQQGVEPKNTDDSELTEEQKRKVAEARARRGEGAEEEAGTGDATGKGE